MLDNNNHFESARARLAERTRAAHQNLHVHPLLVRLTVPGLSRPEFEAILRVHLSFFDRVAAVHAGSGLPKAFSPEAERVALAEDLGIDLVAPMEMELGRAETLGWLYVAHGSQFGRRVLENSVRKSLPEAPARFLSLRGDGAIWRSLIDLINAEGQDRGTFESLSKGAKAAFLLMESEANAAALKLGVSQAE